MKIILDEMGLDQWEKLKGLINSEPNAFHMGKSKERYGHYLHVDAQPITSINSCTGETNIEKYSQVTLEIYDSYCISSGYEGPVGYKEKKDSEKKELKEGLTKLLVELL